ncbi:hypothetical protein K2173_023441 [Erythroxylum novogranatense]|uniref:SKP1-like protein n=1 Tax=Erythroxylum novogranatense TaxID=1862640 RepID=A0AAV8TVU8_9ROSI|nr:hypothetical protein K2173_023441 [Erythroxylum novogranatense]
MSIQGNIVLKSGDGTEYEVHRRVALKLATIKDLVEDDLETSVIPLPSVNSNILDKVIQYCIKHVEVAVNPRNQSADEVVEELKRWGANFLDVNDITLVKLWLAASYLNIDDLVDLSCNAVLDLISAMIKVQVTDFTHDDDA